MTLDLELRGIREDLLSIVGRIDKLLPAKIPPCSDDVIGAAKHCTTAIEWALDHYDNPMSPVQIHEAIKEIGRNDRKDTVQVTTYDLWKRGRIDKVGRGLYAAKAA